MDVRSFFSSLSLMVGCSASTIACADTSLVGHHQDQDRGARRQGLSTVALQQFRAISPNLSCAWPWNLHSPEEDRCLDLRGQAFAVAPGDRELAVGRNSIYPWPTGRAHDRKVLGVPEAVGGHPC